MKLNSGDVVTLVLLGLKSPSGMQHPEEEVRAIITREIEPDSQSFLGMAQRYQAFYWTAQGNCYQAVVLKRKEALKQNAFSYVKNKHVLGNVLTDYLEQLEDTGG